MYVIWNELELAGATVVVHGDARGADRMAKLWAKRNGQEQRVYPADWATYGKTAGPIRNQEMLDKEHRPEEPIELVLAFPGPESIGTYDMLRRAEKAGIPVSTIPH